MEKPAPESNDLKALYAQIEDAYYHIKAIRSEAVGIAATSNIPDATLQLNDVLQMTEQATITILDAATAVGGVVDDSSLGEAEKSTIHEHIGKIYESCSFQDISGQRIKKVLKHVTDLESKLQRLAETARGQQKNETDVSDGSLMNGPALTSDAPSQEDIDNLFKQA